MVQRCFIFPRTKFEMKKPPQLVHLSNVSGFNHQQLYHVVDVRKITTENDEHELAKVGTAI